MSGPDKQELPEVELPITARLLLETFWDSQVRHFELAAAGDLEGLRQAAITDIVKILRVGYPDIAGDFKLPWELP